MAARKLAGLVLAVAVRDNIIRVALERAAREFPVHPRVERVVHEQVSQQRRNHAPNATANFRACHPPCRWCRGGAAAAGWFPDGDAVADGDFLGPDEDVLDDGAQDALAVLGGGGGGALAEPGEETLEVAGELQVGVAVGGLGVEGGDLVLQARFRGRGGRACGRGARRW